MGYHGEMATSLQNSPPSSASQSVLLSGLARALVQKGFFKQAEAEILQTQANATSLTFTEQIITTKKISAYQLAEFASQNFGLPLFDVNTLDLSQINDEWIDIKLVAGRRCLPMFKRGNKLFVGMSDPTQLQALEEFRFKTGLVAEPIVVEDDKLGKMINKVVEKTDKSMSTTNMGDDEYDVDIGLGESGGSAVDDNSEVDDAPIVKFVTKILLDAVAAGVSDVHFEPFEKFYRIRYRLDGVLVDVAQPPISLREKIASRLKVISRLDIAEKRIPQDGRMKMELSKTRAVDFRVSTLPTLHGEKIVLRILDSSAALIGIDNLGYDPDQKQKILDAINRPYGMVLVTGPTGSGKTVSLYTCLGILNKPGINICTVEDPAEITMPGVNQVNVNDKSGLTFAAALKSFLRQDPDIVMVGEIRDQETGEIAIKAAQTGHLVLSTLHTNDAPQTITRLMNMGIAPFNVASTVHLVTAQRLARKLCASCKRPARLPIEALLDAGFSQDEAQDNQNNGWQVYEAVGCDDCKNTGFRGRVGIYQVMPITEEMERIILRHGTTLEIESQARSEGVATLREAGLRKVKSGLTSLTEIEAVTNQ
jgi:type IV pilus assembly protein PilB